MVKIPTAETDDTLLDLKLSECREMDFSLLPSFSNSELENLLDLLPSCEKETGNPNYENANAVHIKSVEV